MKTIGLIGGLSWESTADYYRYINTFVKEQMGGLHSAKLLLYSFDFEEIVALQKAGHWDEATVLMINAAKTLEAGGADIVIICTNTMHKMAKEVQAAITIPLLHIADVTGYEIKKATLKKVGLLGTMFTMEQSFYKEALLQQEIETIIPDKEDREAVHQIIFDELCKGIILPESKAIYLRIIDKLQAQGAEGIILGCTEIPLLIKQEDSSIPLFDTTFLHAQAAVSYALDKNFALK
ncbi:aspartate/glutamate racemase family protein [Niallia sp. FSL W8-0951]|jgi:aspartate racemase|uniref:aspartate/glutamate racemase family protein n=1 Tax=Niallia TaxID=2837506 RepID=UPI0020400C74|nr:aspartate/glutamate racemase family protein [Niallia circulans]MCM2981506.1 aspartate/glutamate racemase family protein [Niallia circulans]